MEVKAAHVGYFNLGVPVQRLGAFQSYSYGMRVILMMLHVLSSFCRAHLWLATLHQSAQVWLIEPMGRSCVD